MVAIHLLLDRQGHHMPHIPYHIVYMYETYTLQQTVYELVEGLQEANS